MQYGHTSDLDLIHRKSISFWIDFEELNKKMPQSFELDVKKVPLKIPLNLKHPLHGNVSTNMINVSKWIVQKHWLKSEEN